MRLALSCHTCQLGNHFDPHGMGGVAASDEISCTVKACKSVYLIPGNACLYNRALVLLPEPGLFPIKDLHTDTEIDRYRPDVLQLLGAPHHRVTASLNEEGGHCLAVAMWPVQLPFVQIERCHVVPTVNLHARGRQKHVVFNLDLFTLHLSHSYISVLLEPPAVAQVRRSA